MAKKFEELTISDDFMFCILMQNPKYCKPFLETILDIKIARIVYPEAQKTINLLAEAKSIRLDIYLEDNENTVYNIEMQNTGGTNLPKRTRYYQGMIDLNLLEKGKDYTSLKQSYIIFVCTFDPFGLGKHVYTFENRCVQDQSLLLGDEAYKIILNTKGAINDVRPELKKLLDFIDGKQPEDEFTRLLSEEIATIRKSEKWRLEYMKLELEYAEKYQQGMQQEAVNVVGRMIDAGKLSEEEIAMYLDLPIEKIREMKNSLNKVKIV